jgi:cyclophilin family peptidyl-prolyl cis-trans isomerase
VLDDSFTQVTGGIDAVDAIEAVETDSAAKPRDPVVVEGVELPG